MFAVHVLVPVILFHGWWVDSSYGSLLFSCVDAFMFSVDIIMTYQISCCLFICYNIISWCRWRRQAARTNLIWLNPLGRWWERPRYSSLADEGASFEQRNKCNKFTSLTNLRYTTDVTKKLTWKKTSRGMVQTELIHTLGQWLFTSLTYLMLWLSVSMTYLICESLGQAGEPGGQYQCFTCGVGKLAKLP